MLKLSSWLFSAMPACRGSASIPCVLQQPAGRLNAGYLLGADELVRLPIGSFCLLTGGRGAFPTRKATADKEENNMGCYSTVAHDQKCPQGASTEVCTLRHRHPEPQAAHEKGAPKMPRKHTNTPTCYVSYQLRFNGWYEPPDRRREWAD